MPGSQRQLELVLKLKDQASKDLKRFNGNLRLTERDTRFLDAAARMARTAIIGLGTAAAGFIGYGVKVAADLQTAEVGLTTLLGSAEEAEATIKRLKVEAARTPFELPGLTQATQLLTSVTKDGDRSIDILLDVGEALAAMGKGQAELDRIIVNMQQIAATGRAMSIDIRQFAFAGIPIYEMLTETTGKAGEELEELISSGGVTFDLLTTMFDEANDAGGRFFNAFQNQSGTFNQAWSNMKDSVGILAAEFVTSTGLLDNLADAMVGLSDVIASSSLLGFLEELDRKTGIVTLFKEAWEDVTEALRPLQPFFEALGQILAGTVIVVLGGLIITIREIIVQFAAALEKMQAVSNFLIDIFAPAWNGIAASVQTVYDGVTALIDVFKRAISLAKELTGGAIDFVAGLLPGRASGGTVTGGRAYMVGEQGPELFVPRGGGSIVPNHALAGGAGSVTVNIMGGYYLSDDAAERIGDEIINKLKTSRKL